MVYIDLRYTPQIEVINEDGTVSEDLSQNKVGEILTFINDYLFFSVQKDKKTDSPSQCDYQYYTQPKHICNVEFYNKFGEKTHMHYHMNFYLEDHPFNRRVKKDSLAKKLNREFGLKGNKMYCLRVHNDIPENVGRWWRYTLKQSNLTDVADENQDWVSGFSQSEIDAMHILAADEYEQRKVENCAARQKMADKNNFRYKLVKHFKKKASDREGCGGARLDDKQLWCGIASYYMEHQMTPPFGKMDDVLIDLKVEIGYITIDEYYDLSH